MTNLCSSKNGQLRKVNLIILQNTEKELGKWNTEVRKFYEPSVDTYLALWAILNCVITVRQFRMQIGWYKGLKTKQKRLAGPRYDSVQYKVPDPRYEVRISGVQMHHRGRTIIGVRGLGSRANHWLTYRGFWNHTWRAVIGGSSCKTLAYEERKPKQSLAIK
ncbi:hypothetical protein Tco_1210434 [Tanacetum coccineum]